MMVKFTIYGKPMTKGRPRFTKQGFAYTPKETVNYENLIRLEYQNQVGEYFQGKIEMHICAYFEIPKSTSKKRREQLKDETHYYDKRPDYDNICKVVTDALNKVAYSDDGQIVKMTVEKKYSERPRVEVEIKEVTT